MERILLEAITSQTKHMTGKIQHGFIRGKACLTNLITLYNKLTCSVDAGWAMDIVYLDFSKAFNSFPQPHARETYTLWSRQVLCELGWVWLTTQRGW